MVKLFLFAVRKCPLLKYLNFMLPSNDKKKGRKYRAFVIENQSKFAIRNKNLPKDS